VFSYILLAMKLLWQGGELNNPSDELSMQERCPGNNVYFTPDVSGYASPAVKHAVLDMASFCSELGFRPVITSKGSRGFRVYEYYAELIRAWKTANVFFTTYPTIGSPIAKANRLRELDAQVFRLLRRISKKTNSIVYVDDLPIEQNRAAKYEIDKKAFRLERTILHAFDILCVFNDAVRDILSERYDIDRTHFVVFQVQDYRVAYDPPRNRKPPEQGWTIVYTGNCNSRRLGKWLEHLPPSSIIRYEFVGPYCDWTSRRKDVIYRGVFDTTDILAEYMANQCHFGIFAGSESYTDYYNFTSTSKLGAYLTAGLPVLVRSDYRYIASLVNEHGLGFVFDSSAELPALLEKLSWEDYVDVRQRCLEFGRRMRNGEFFKRAMRVAFLRLGLHLSWPRGSLDVPR
jgi:hypothetical protein